MLATLLLSIGSGVIAWVLVTTVATKAWARQLPPPYARIHQSEIWTALRIPIVLCAMVFVPILVELVTM